MTTTEITPCERCRETKEYSEAMDAGYEAWFAGLTPEQRAEEDAYCAEQEREYEESKTTPDYDTRYMDVPYVCPDCGMVWE